MSYSDLPKFLQGYALEITSYFLNSVPTDYVPNTPIELWTASLVYNTIEYGGVRRMYLKENIKKLETKSELCYFVGYSKGTKGWLFYDSREQIVLVSTNTTFLEDDYMMDRKPNDRFDLMELIYTPREPLEGSSNLMEDVLETTTSSLLDT